MNSAPVDHQIGSKRICKAEHRTLENALCGEKNAKENISEDKIYFLDCGRYFPYLSPKLL